MGLTSCLTSCLSIQGQLTDSCIDKCNSDNGWSSPLNTTQKVVYSVATALLVLLTTVIACMMGSTLGIDMATLQAGMQGSDAGVRRKSRRVVRLRSIGGSLLFSALLVTTVATHVAVAVLLTKLLGAIGGLFVAFALILVFAEILPPAFCSTHALEIAWSTAWLASVLLILLFPLAWPVSILLDRLIVHEKTQSTLARWCCPCFKSLQQSPSRETLSPQDIPDTTTYSEDDQDTYTSAPYGGSEKLTSVGTPSLPSTSPMGGYLQQQVERATVASSAKSQSTSSTPPIAQVISPGPYPPDINNSPTIASASLADDSRRDDPHEMTFKDLVDPGEIQPPRPVQVSATHWETRGGSREETSESSSHSQALSQSHSHSQSLSQSRRTSAIATSSASTDSTISGERGERGERVGGSRASRQLSTERRTAASAVTSRQVAVALEKRVFSESQTPIISSGRSGQVAIDQRVTNQSPPSPQVSVVERKGGGDSSGGGGEGAASRLTRPVGVLERRISGDSLGKSSPQQGGGGGTGGGTGERNEKIGEIRGGKWQNLRNRNEFGEGGGSSKASSSELQRLGSPETEGLMDAERKLVPKRSAKEKLLPPEEQNL